MSERKIKQIRKELRKKLNRPPRETLYNIKMEVVEPNEFRKFKKELKDLRYDS